jgi:hypothetical protein
MFLYCAPFVFLFAGKEPLAATSESQKSNQEGRTSAEAVASVLERLQRIVPEVQRAQSCLRAKQLAGRYSAETPLTAGMIGGTSGNSLYLFRDGSYLYVEWADIFPETLMDRGRWSLRSGMLELTSDSLSADKGFLEDTHYVAFCLPESGRPALRIVGSNRQLAMLEKEFKEDQQGADNRRFLLMLYSRERLDEYSTPDASRQAMKEVRRRVERH